MTRQELIQQIEQKQSFLCVGLDTDAKKMPQCVFDLHDPIFDFNKADLSLMQLMEEYPGNLTALNYLLAWDLLNKNLGGFVAHCPFEAFTSAVPKAWQEGFLLDWEMTGLPMEELPDFIDGNLADRKAAFTRDFNANVPMATLQRQYGDTYWFYYFFK